MFANMWVLAQFLCSPHLLAPELFFIYVGKGKDNYSSSRHYFLELGHIVLFAQLFDTDIPAATLPYFMGQSVTVQLAICQGKNGHCNYNGDFRWYKQHFQMHWV